MTTRMLGRLRFLDSGKDDALMQRAEQAVRDRGVEPVWVSGDLKAEQVNKESIYVLENFDSPPFKLLAKKCRLVGPGVVLAHLQRGLPLPAAMQPVFSLAMLNIVACFTQPGPREKRDLLCERVVLMGGKVLGDFTRHVTHLIAGQVGSTKYNVARQLGIPVMLPSWVEDCWEKGLNDVIYAADDEVITLHRCPPLTGCTITVTGLDEGTRRQVSELCLKHGGAYSGELVKDSCTHLLVGSKNSTKYKYARQWGVECVTLQWLHDSVACGYCMPEKDYDVELSPASSRRPSAPQEEGKPSEDWVRELQEYQVPASSEACFLDGCKLYFSGFTEQQLEKLYRIVNIGGGARFSDLNPGVSHVVMGKQLLSELASLNQLGHCPHVVSVKWLLACCSSGTRTPEESYVCLRLQLQASPLQQQPSNKRTRSSEDCSDLPSKKVFRPLPPPPDQLLTRPEDSDLLNEYGAARMPPCEGLFSGKSFSMSLRFNAQDMLTATGIVQSNGGKVVGPLGDYHVVPLELVGEAVSSSAQLVTMVWVQRCIDSKCLLDPSSYFLFQPVPTPLSRTTLGGCVLALSQFSDLEREHLVRFCQGLGAVVQDPFVHHPSRALMASTHLVLKEAGGEKYECAAKWGIPAVRDSWLFACAKARCVAPVEEHLVKPLLLMEQNLVKQVPTGDDFGQGPVQKAATAVNLEKPDITVKPIQPLEACKAVPSAEPFKQVLLGSTTSSGGPTLETPLKNFRPHFDIKPALELLPSPIPGNNTQLAEMFEINMAKALETATKAESEANMKEAVLRGTVLCLSKKLTSYADLHSLACLLGAECRRYVDDSCTHYVGQSKGTGDKEWKAAKDRGCYLVSPHWVFECDKAMKKVDEALYPPTYNPSMALNISSTHKSAPSKEALSEDEVAREQHADEVAREQHADEVAREQHAVEVAREQHGNEAGSPTRQPLPDPTHHHHLSPSKPCPTEPLLHQSPPTKPPPQDPEAPVLEKARQEQELRQELEELRHSVCGGDPKQRRKSRRLVQQRGVPIVPPPLPSPGARSRRSRRWRGKEVMVDSQLSDSQVMTVVYDDPAGRKAKEKLLEAIEREEQLKAKGIDPRLLRSPPKGPDIQLILPPLNSELEERIFAAYVSPLQTKITDSSLLPHTSVPPASTSIRQTGLERKVQSGEEALTGLEVAPDGKTVLPVEAVPIGGSDGRGTSDDLPSATPAPPPLNVPIVTHARPTSEGVGVVSTDFCGSDLMLPYIVVSTAQPLFDEGEVTRKLRPQPRKFLLSLLEPSEKTDYGALIQELGGEYMDVDYFTTSCTHLIVGKASRTEKYLGACACGKWVLRKSYLESCRAAKKFVEEEPHEWGERLGNVPLEPLECAPKKWRLALSKSNKGGRRPEGAFHGWKVLVCMEKKKLLGLKRLLEAGGAEVILPTSSSVSIRGLTHALINMGYFPSDLLTLEDLVKEGVHCLKPEFITDYLSKGDDSDMESSYLPQVKAMLKR